MALALSETIREPSALCFRFALSLDSVIIAASISAVKFRASINTFLPSVLYNIVTTVFVFLNEFLQSSYKMTDSDFTFLEAL
jgi:hypothetical protein